MFSTIIFFISASTVVYSDNPIYPSRRSNTVPVSPTYQGPCLDINYV